MLCFPGIHELNLKVCLGRLNTDSFAQENSRLAETIAPEGRSGRGLPVPNARASMGMISVDAGCRWAYPRGSLGPQRVWLFPADTMLSAAQDQTCASGK